MNKPEITGDWVDRYNEDDLSEGEKLVFEQRMRADPLLRSEVFLDARLEHFLHDGEALDLMRKVRSVTSRRPRGGGIMHLLLMAATLLCLLAVGGIFYYYNAAKNRAYRFALQDADCVPVRAKAMPDSLRDSCNGPFPETKGWVAKNFTPLPELELLAGSVTRSHVLKMVLPHANAAFPPGAGVQFEWSYCSREVPVYIVILDNRGIRNREIQVTGRAFHLQADDLAEGLYYWKIMVEDELAAMGKFIILEVKKD